jgi:hypothetical protein
MSSKYDVLLRKLRESDSGTAPGYATLADLQAVTGSKDDFAIVEDTDTLWLWDADTNVWVQIGGSAGISWSIISSSGANIAIAGNGYIFDASENAVPLTLPAHELGRTVYFVTKDHTNTCTLVRNGGTGSIDGNAGDLTLNADRGANGVVSDGISDWFLTYK